MLAETPMVAETPMFADLQVLAQCRRRAQDIVLVEPWTGVSFTGADLAIAVERARAALLRAGVAPGHRVGLALERSIDLVVALLAIAGTGAAYVPLDPSLPSDRLRLMAEDAGVTVAVAEPSIIEILSGGDGGDGPGARAHVEVLTPQRLRAVPAADLEQLQPAQREPDDLAYVIYTSGSTGRPKGVMISHRNLSAFLSSWDAVVDPAQPGTWLASTTISFDPSVVELLWTLSRGATAVLASEGGMRSDVGDIINRHGVTHFQCTPTWARLLLDDPVSRTALGRIQRFFIGGEALTPALVARLYATGLGRITNIYGPTESTVWAFAHDVARGAVAPIPIGHSLPGIECGIDGVDGAPVAPGEVGELRIGGASVALGYLGLADLTAERFVSRDGGRWYRTGDLVRLEPDGTYTFHGRTDHQVKLNGVRIELGEIEAQLESHPAVAQCAVTMLTDRLQQNYLAAWYVAALAAQVDTSVLKAHLALSVAPHSVPRTIHRVDSFQLTATGKVDRNQLAALVVLDDARAETGSPGDEVVAPGEVGDVDALARDFASALDVAAVTVDADFFDLGGNSLVGTALAVLVFDRTGVRMPLRALVEAPTPRLLATLLGQLAAGTGDDHVQVLVRFAPRRATVPQLYLVHGAGGNVMVYRDLAGRMASSLDLVGVQAAGVEPGHPIDSTMEAMVNRYVNALLADRDAAGDSGPILLGGYSNGGRIALQMAAHLHAAGFSVAPVALLDSYVDERLTPSRVGRLLSVLYSARTRGPCSLADWARWSVAGWRGRFDSNIPTELGDQVVHYAELEDTIERITASASTSLVVPGGAFLLRAQESNPMYRLCYDWSQVLAAPVPVRFVPGGHLGLLRPANVDALAVALVAGFGSWLSR